MKFGSTWKAAVATWPGHWAEASISYKRWKKVQPGEDDVLRRLLEECARCNAAFEHLCAAHLAPPRPWRALLGCAVPPAAAEDAGEATATATAAALLEFAQLNQTCAYKIHKRLRKRGVLAATAPRPAPFISGFWRARIRLDALGWAAWDACPVCLGARDEVAEQGIYVLQCGHCLCMPCMRAVWEDGTRRRGVLRNLLLTQELRRAPRCPMCMSRRVLGDAGDVCVWPPEHARRLVEWCDRKP